MRGKLLVLAFALALLLAGCAGGAPGDAPGGISVEDAWVRPSPLQAGNGAAYMLIRNATSEDDALLAARSEVAEAVELHESVMTGADMMSMHAVERIDIPAGGSAALEPGGLHVMLIGLRETLREGDSVALTLVFEKAGEITVEAPVKEQ